MSRGAGGQGRVQSFLLQYPFFLGYPPSTFFDWYQALLSLSPSLFLLLLTLSELTPIPPFPPYLPCLFPSPVFPSSHPAVLHNKLRHSLKWKGGKGQLTLTRTQWTHATIPFCLYTSYIGYVEIYLPERSKANRLSSWAIFGKISFSIDVGLSCMVKKTARKKINKPSIASPYQSFTFTLHWSSLIANKPVPQCLSRILMFMRKMRKIHFPFFFPFTCNIYF